MKLLLTGMVFFFFYSARSQTLKLDSTFESIGVTVSLPAGFDADQTGMEKILSK